VDGVAVMHLCVSIGGEMRWRFKHAAESSYRRTGGAASHLEGKGGYDFGKAVNRVAGLFDMKPREILFPGKRSV